MGQLTLIQDRPVLAGRAFSPVSDRARRVIIAGLLLTVAFVALQGVSQVIDFKVFNLRVRAFNSDKHDSLFGLVSLLAQVGAAAASGLRGGIAPRHRWSARLGVQVGPYRRAWLGLGVLVVALVIVRGLTTFNASVLAAPLACVFLLLCWLTWRDPGVPRTVVWSGLALMAISLLLHKVGLAADTSTASDYTWAYQITGIVKHGAELAGWMLLTVGIIAGSERRPAPTVTTRSS